MKRTVRDVIEAKGVVYRQLVNSQKLKDLLEVKTGLNFDDCYMKDDDGNRTDIIEHDALCAMGLQVLGKKDFKKLFDQAVKKQFADNFIWRFLKKRYNLDLVIPGITGFYTTKAIKCNLVVNSGHAGYAGQFCGVTTAPFTAMAYGTGSVAASATDTSLGTETSRAAATISRVTTVVTNDTAQWVHTFTAGTTQAITEEGIFDNNTSGGNMGMRQVFSAINMVLNDTLQLTHKVQS